MRGQVEIVSRPHKQQVKRGYYINSSHYRKRQSRVGGMLALRLSYSLQQQSFARNRLVIASVNFSSH